MAREATEMILACESCGEHRRHHKRLIGRIDTLEEHRELVCAECGSVNDSVQTLAPVVSVRVHINIDADIER